MSTVTRNVFGIALCAAALVAASAEIANAQPTRLVGPTNLRQGPGTNFGVITTMPAGGVVDVIRCGPEWCNVMFRGRPGYAIARNLGAGGPAPVRVVGAPPPPVVVVDPYPYPYYYGRPYYYGPRFYYGPRRYWGYRRW